MAARCVPASHVGGDHYTYRWLDEEQKRLCFLIGDVAGKGMKAAMTVMRFLEVLYYEIQTARSPSEMLTCLSRALQGRMGRHQFITAIVAILDVETGLLTVSCAGHPAMYIYAHADHSIMEVDCAAESLNRICSAVRIYTGSLPQEDDMTAIVVRAVGGR